MLQLPRVEWRLLACLNGASPDFIIVVCCVLCVVLLFVVVLLCVVVCCCVLLCVVVCCCCRDLSGTMSMSTSSEDEIVLEPSMAKNSSPSRAPKNGAQLQTTWRSAKNASKPPKPHPTAI